MGKTGIVYLVGAGPGRADLITLRGARLLGRADVVVMDALVNRRLLGHCRPGARVVDAGKRGDGRVRLGQGRINSLLVALARRGKTVVRLKGGDPYFFGRGGEEAEHLFRWGIPFEVVPGVTSVTAVPAYAGIPVTHRGRASQVTVVTGHGEDPNPYLKESRAERARRRSPGVDWRAIPREGTLVILMGLKRLPEIAEELRAVGWPAATPVAVIERGTWPDQKDVRGTLADAAAKARAAGLRPPAVIVVGDVVRLAPSLHWAGRRALQGRRVLVTRAPEQTAPLTDLLEEAGAEVLESPVIRIVPLPRTAAGRAHIMRLRGSGYGGVLFSSANAARVFAGHWRRRPWPAGVGVYAVGPKTARALAEAGLPVTATASEYVAEGLLKMLGNVRGKKFLFPRALEGRDVVLDTLARRGASVTLWPLYRTVGKKLSPPARRALLGSRVDAVTFTSASTVRGLMEQLTPSQRRRLFARTKAVAIGPITAAALRRFGVRRPVTARPSTVEGLALALAKGLM
jgi:uroporphyrinogen III methyltransferase/synthase